MKVHLFLLLFLLNLLNADTKTLKEPKNNLIIGYSGSPLSVDYWKKLKDSLFTRGKELNVMVIDFTSDKFTFEEQKKALKRAANLNLNGMIIGADSSKVASHIEQFKKKNIPVIAVASDIKNDWVSTNIITDNSNAVKLAVKFIKKNLKDKIKKLNKIIILCGDKDHINAKVRASASSSLLKEKDYNVQIHYSKGWSSKNSLNDAIKEYSKNGKEIIASFSCYAGASIASVNAAEAYGLRPLQVGFDMDKNMKEMIKQGRLDATIVQDPKTVGKVAIESMVKVLRENNTLEKYIDIPAKLITKENIDNF